MSPNTSTALFITFPKDRRGLQIKMPRAITCSAACGHLTQCCQFDDGTRQLAKITYKDALEKHGCLDMEDLQFEAEFLTWDQASQNSFTFACHLTSTLDIRVKWRWATVVESQEEGKLVKMRTENGVTFMMKTEG